MNTNQNFPESKKSSEPHWAQYGKVFIPRALCPNCERQSFILEGKLVCCGLPFKFNTKKIKHETTVLTKRYNISKKSRKDILVKQRNCCFYCLNPIGSLVYIHKESIFLVDFIDHVEPFTWINPVNNKPISSVVSCQICRLIKYGLRFDSAETARNYIQSKWKEKGIFLV